MKKSFNQLWLNADLLCRSIVRNLRFKPTRTRGAKEARRSAYFCCGPAHYLKTSVFKQLDTPPYEGVSPEDVPPSRAKAAGRVPTPARCEEKEYKGV